MRAESRTPSIASRRGAAAQRFLLRRRRVRSGLVQLIYVMLGSVLGLGLPRVTSTPTVDAEGVAQLLWTLAATAIGLVAIVYSLLFLVVQWAASAFSPRVTLFRDDPILWHCSGFLTGTIMFGLVAGLSINGRSTVSVAVPVAAIIAMLAAVALIRILQVRAFRSIQLNTVLETIADRGRDILDAIYDAPFAGSAGASSPLPPFIRTVHWTRRSATLQHIDLRKLMAAAREVSAVVSLRVGVGQPLREGSAVADIHGHDVDEAQVLAALQAGHERTFQQDPLFAFQLLVDIAMRALSSAINDQTTAVQVLHVLDGLLNFLGSRDLDVAEVRDERGEVVIVVALPAWEQYVEASFDDLIAAGSHSPRFLARVNDVLAVLGERVPEGRRSALSSRAVPLDRSPDGQVHL